jgi:hypothetical protein
MRPCCGSIDVKAHAAAMRSRSSPTDAILTNFVWTWQGQALKHEFMGSQCPVSESNPITSFKNSERPRPPEIYHRAFLRLQGSSQVFPLQSWDDLNGETRKESVVSGRLCGF